MKNNFDFLLLDAANTIIHKPMLWIKYQAVLTKHQFYIENNDLKQKHKLVSEIINFPDQTSKDFYEQFNTEVLLSLGIIPNKKLLDDLFEACTYLPWEVFEDVSALEEIDAPKAILSNFNHTLSTKINQLFGNGFFQEIITSEEEGIRKPDRVFYQRAVEKIGVEPQRILYVGDSLKLDIIPAKTIGLNAVLVDREEVFPYFSDRITSFKELIKS